SERAVRWKRFRWVLGILSAKTRRSSRSFAARPVPEVPAAAGGGPEGDARSARTGSVVAHAPATEERSKSKTTRSRQPCLVTERPPATARPSRQALRA